VDHEAEFDSLFEVNDSYADLLQHGHVERSSSDPEEWRAEIRRQARQDKIPVRTFRHGDQVIAVRTREPVSDDEMRHAMKVMEIQRRRGQSASAWPRDPPLAGRPLTMERQRFPLRRCVSEKRPARSARAASGAGGASTLE
jgi:hypothetical protein